MGTLLTGQLGRIDLVKIDSNEILVNLDKNFNRFNSAQDDAESFEELIQSIQQYGQLEPVIISRDKETGKAVVRAGFRRTQAIQELNRRLEREGQPSIPVLCKMSSGNEENFFMINLEENLRRQNLSPMDLAKTVQRLQDVFQKDENEIAKILNKSVATVYQLRSLNTLADDVQQKIHSGEIPFSSALVLVTLPAEKVAEVVEAAEVIAEVKDEIKTEKKGKKSEKSEKTEKKPKVKVSISAVKEAARDAGIKQKRSMKEVKEVLIKLSSHEIASKILDFMNGDCEEGDVINVFYSYEKVEIPEEVGV